MIDDRAELPVAGDEIATMLGSLDRQRATFAWKCGGLDAAGLNATVGASTMTLGGLLKHVALVEEIYFTLRLGGRPPMAPFDTVDWDNDPGWDWRTAADDTPEQLMTLWRTAVARSKAVLAEALTRGDLSQRVEGSDWTEPPNLRRVLVDMIEEYARHTGHADLIRESVDGLTGEDPPD